MPPKTAQAFPFIKPHEDVGAYHPGMTLREHFATAVVCHYLSQGYVPSEAAELAFVVADEMMKARK
jgi:hypothetical protein